MEDIRVSVTGIGISSQFGNTLERFWKSVISGEKPLKENVASDHSERLFLDACITTVLDAIKDADVETKGEKGCFILGTGMGISDVFLAEEKTVPPDTFQLKEKISKRLEEQTGMQWRTIIIANACCAGAQAIAYGFDMVRSRQYDFVVAGGIEIESQIMRNGFQRLNSIDEECCRPFDKSRKGIRVGEGAVFFVLQTKRKWVYGEILGQAVTNDAYHIVSPRPGGEYIQNVIELSLQRSNRKPEEIDAVVAHGTGTRKNDAIEAQVLERIFKNVYVTAPKCVIGHTGGASGAFGLLTALGMLQYQEIPPIHHLKQLDEDINILVVQNKPQKASVRNVLINCFAFGGTNIALVCGR